MSGCVPTRLHAQYLPQGKESYSETSFVSKEEVVYLRQHFTQTESHEANIMVESQANELQLPLSLKPVKELSQMTPTWN